MVTEDSHSRARRLPAETPSPAAPTAAPASAFATVGALAAVSSPARRAVGGCVLVAGRPHTLPACGIGTDLLREKLARVRHRQAVLRRVYLVRADGAGLIRREKVLCLQLRRVVDALQDKRQANVRGKAKQLCRS